MMEGTNEWGGVEVNEEGIVVKFNGQSWNLKGSSESSSVVVNEEG